MPEIFQKPLRHLWWDRLTWDQLIEEMDQKLKLPGVVNAWTMPIKTRIDMLATGVRTPIGIKIYGSDLDEIERLGAEIERAIQGVPGTRSVYAERTGGGYFLDFHLKREELARYGLTIKEVEMVIMSAIGGETVTTTVEGRERYTVNVRYARELRDDLEKLRRVLVPIQGGAHVPLGDLARLELSLGPGMIRNENGMLAGYVYVDVAGRDIGHYVDEAKRRVAALVKLPSGYTLQWSGQYENLTRVKERLKVVVPLTLFLIVVLLYQNTKSAAKTGIVLLAVPFSLVGAICLLYLLGYHVSIGVWVGLIALLGLDAETGIFMLLFLDLAYHDRVRRGVMKTWHDLEEAVVHGAVKRIRPKLMTVAATFIGLVPIMWAMGTGSDLMKRIAAPMVGGILTSFLLELLVYPPLYAMWKWHGEMKRGAGDVTVLPQGKVFSFV